MEKDLHKFYDNINIFNKDLAEYNDDKGNYFVFNTINLLLRIDKLELTKEEYQVAKFQQKVEDLEYNVKNIKKPVPKNTITGKDEDKFTIVEKEVAVREIWNVSNALGIIKSFTNKQEAIETAKAYNKTTLKYFISND
jgi:hypothetical protein